MSTELFRKYLNLLNESADLTQLTQSLTELETVLDKYKDKIHESLAAQDPLLEAPRTPEQQAAMDALRQGGTPTPTAPGELPRGGTRNPTRDWRSPRTIDDQAAREAEALRLEKQAAELEREAAKAAKGSVLKRGVKGLGVVGALAGAAYLAPKAWDLITGVYQLFTKYKFEDLESGDQEIINKNISIIQPYYEQEKFSQLPVSLQTRLITVATQLGKLKSKLTLPNNTLPLTRSQEIDAAHKLNVKENATIRDQMQQLNQLSDVEQMALLRALVNEGWYDDAKSAYKSTVDKIDSAASSVWNSDILRYLGWPTALAGSVTASGYLWTLWKIFSKNYDSGSAPSTTAAPATAAAAPVTPAPDAGPRILGPDGNPLPPSRAATPTRTPAPAIPEVEPPQLGSSKLAAFKKFLGTMAGGKKKALQAILATALTGMASWGLWTAAGVNTGAEVAKDVGKWAANDLDKTAEEEIQKLAKLNSSGQFWDDNFVSEQDRKNMLEVVIAYCNRHPKYQGCEEQKSNLCSLIPGLKGC
jgi:hypothetical protein